MSARSLISASISASTGPGRLIWGVFAATPERSHTALSGSYCGAMGQRSLGLGLGGNALVGGNAYSIGLQPLSVNAQTGVDITAGITGLQLERRRAPGTITVTIPIPDALARGASWRERWLAAPAAKPCGVADPSAACVKERLMPVSGGVFGLRPERSAHRLL